MGAARPLFEVWSPSTDEELERAAQGIRESRANPLVIMGGDGSLMRALSQLHKTFGAEALPAIIPLAAGTVNLAVRRFGGRDASSETLERLLVSPIRRRTFARSLEVTLDGRVHLGFTVGGGLVSNFFSVYESLPHRGNVLAAAIVARTFAGACLGSEFSKRIFAPTPGRLTTPDTDFGVLQLTLLIASVFENLGLGLRPTYRACERADRIHLVSSTLPARTLASKLPRVMAGRPLERAPQALSVIDTLTPSFELTFEHPTKVVLDGDVIEALRVQVREGRTLTLESV